MLEIHTDNFEMINLQPNALTDLASIGILTLMVDLFVIELNITNLKR
jgi:hypothetical protein